MLRRISLAAASLTLALSAGCGQPAVTAEEALELEAADSSPDLRLSSERWMVVQAPEGRLFLAAVVEPQGRGAMLVDQELHHDRGRRQREAQAENDAGWRMDPAEAHDQADHPG